MNRRLFLSGLAGLVAGAALDPDELLWKPTKTIFVPSASPCGYVLEDWVTKESLQLLTNQLEMIRYFHTTHGKHWEPFRTVKIRLPQQWIVEPSSPA